MGKKHKLANSRKLFPIYLLIFNGCKAPKKIVMDPGKSLGETSNVSNDPL